METVLDKAAYIERESKDFLARRGDIRIVAEPDNIFLHHELSDTKIPFSNWSLSQMCDFLDVPTRYIRKCIEKYELPFAAENMNKWLAKDNQDKEFLLRTTNDRLHGFLSSKYGIMDDFKVLSIANDVIGDIGDYSVKNYLITPEMMNVRVVDKKLINIDGEDLSVGLNIKNSRVGQSSLEVRLMIFKWICSNGVIFGGGKGVLYSRQHRGAFENDFLNEFPNTIENIPQIVARIKTWVEKSKDRKVDSDIIQTMIDKMKREGYATIPVAAKIIDLIPKYGETRWGVAQAVSEIAQEYSIDTRERLEMYAGEIIMAS